jgi:hypothetical protein
MRDARFMASPIVPADLRERLEATRLDLLALYRSLDRMALAPEEIPQRLLRQLYELDADCAEALWALDQPPGTLNLHAMVRDTLAALDQAPEAAARLRRNLPPRALPVLAHLEAAIRERLNPAEAYHSIPGLDPESSQISVGSEFSRQRRRRRSVRKT